MLEGKMKQETDIIISLAYMVNVAVWSPKELNNIQNPWTVPKLAAEQLEAKKKFDAERTFKMMRKGLSMFVKNKPKKLTPKSKKPE